MSFFRELKRRNVFRVGAAYVVASWLLIQVAETLFPVFGYGDAPTRIVVIVLAIGLVPALIFAWAFELTPEGLKREKDVDRSQSITPHTGRKLDRLIMLVLALALAYFAFDKFVLEPQRESEQRAALDAQKAAEVARAREQALEEGRKEALEASFSEQSIAVLPFVNMSPDKDQEYFSDGISEELLNLLAKIPELKVTARTSSFSFKGKEVEIPEIGRQLHVANVLEGSVRRSGDKVRITAQLIHAADGFHLWSQTYDREFGDIFAIQDDIASRVVAELKVSLLGSLPKARTTEPRAYALYLQAKELAHQKTTESFAASDELYNRVLAIDPGYGPAWIGLSGNIISEMGLGVLSGKAGYSRARVAAEKALSIDPDFAQAHAALGRLALYEGDLPAAGHALEQALALDPADPGALSNAATYLQSLGRLDQALVLDQFIVRRDPVNASSYYNLATDQVWAGQFDEGIATLNTVLKLSPDRGGAHASIGTALLFKGDFPAALAEIEQEKNEFWRMLGMPMAYHALGRKSDSDQALAALIGAYEAEGPYNIAYVFAFRGEADRAFEWLGKAIEYQDPGLSEIVVENLFDNIHPDPRWLPFLESIGKSPSQLARIPFEVGVPR